MSRSKDSGPDAEALTAAMDAQVAEQRDNPVLGPNEGGFVQVEGHGHSEEAVEAIVAASGQQDQQLDPSRPHLSESDLAAEKLALAADAQVAASTGAGPVQISDGVQTSAPTA